MKVCLKFDVILFKPLCGLSQLLEPKRKNIKMNFTIFKNFSNYWIILLFLNLFFCANSNNTTPIPSSCDQIILVLTDSVKATKGTLYCFERNNTKTDWNLLSDPSPVVIGRNGLGWGVGLHKLSNKSNLPIKEEGDGRSPAGVFKLSSVFGYKRVNQMIELKMPYIHITEMVECVDDVKSKYYNQIVTRDKIEKVDWESSEKMYFAGIYYELGVVVDHNCNPIKKNSGSCIFLHNWSNPNETMAGCTAMAPTRMKEIVYWLNKAKNPTLIQLTKQLYLDLKMLWQLPEVEKI